MSCSRPVWSLMCPRSARFDGRRAGARAAGRQTCFAKLLLSLKIPKLAGGLILLTRMRKAGFQFKQNLINIICISHQLFMVLT